MSRTARFRQDHQEIITLADEVKNLLSTDRIKEDVGYVRATLSKFAGVVKVHLSMEEQCLYPFLADSPDDSVRNISSKYMHEMGGIKTSFEDYLTRWASGDIIASDADGFIAETKGIIGILVNRLEREDREFYPVADVAA